jgi:hypothetical protein
MADSGLSPSARDSLRQRAASIGERNSQPADRPAQARDDRRRSCRAVRRARLGAEALRENRTGRGSSVASEPPRDDDEPNLSTRQWRIGQPPFIAAVDSFHDWPAVRTSARFARVANSESRDRAIMNCFFYVEIRQNKSRGAQATGHGVDSFVKQTRAGSQTSSIMSQMGYSAGYRIPNFC